MNADAPWPSLQEAESRVLGLQTKLHRWAVSDPGRRFDDLYNLVHDPAFLVVAWNRVRGNKGARSAGVDGQTARSIEAGLGEEVFLAELRSDLKARIFRLLPVRERDPKAEREAPIPRDPNGAGPCGPGGPQAVARADLRGGL